MTGPIPTKGYGHKSSQRKMIMKVSNDLTLYDNLSSHNNGYVIPGCLSDGKIKKKKLYEGVFEGIVGESSKCENIKKNKAV